jgi:type I restriction enzyme, S subunit
MSFPKYEVYKDSGVEWLGEVPEHWETMPFFSRFRARKGQNTGLQENNLLSLSYGRIVEKDINTLDGLLPESFETYQIVSPCDIVFRLTDLQNDKRSLRSAIVQRKGIITSAYLAVESLNIDSCFANYLFRAYDLLKVFYSMGGGLRQSMKYSDMKWLPILTPPSSEQRQIADFLDRETTRIDALIAEQQRLIELLKEKRQAVISHAVTKGIDRTVPMKDSGVEWLGKVPEHWTVGSLRWYASIQGGLAKGKDYEGRKTVTLPYLRVANVQNGFLDLTEVKEIEVLETDIERYSLRSGDVLMNEGGDNDKLGRGAVWAEQISPCLHQNHVFAIRTNDQLLSQWLATFTQSQQAQTYFYLNSKQSTNLASISASNVMNMDLPIPNVNEQKQILEYLEKNKTQNDQLIQVAVSTVSLLQERRSALISAAVTGKIDVRNWQPSPEPTATHGRQ